MGTDLVERRGGDRRIERTEPVLTIARSDLDSSKVQSSPPPSPSAAEVVEKS